MNARAFIMGLVAGVVVVGAPVGRYAYLVTQQKNSLEGQVFSLQARNSRIASAAQELAKRDLPVEIRYRQHVLFAAGAQLIIQNTSGADLPVTAEFSRADSPSVTREVVVPANGFVSVDAHQGWAFEPGDSIRLHNPKYRDWINRSIGW